MHVFALAPIWLMVVAGTIVAVVAMARRGRACGSRRMVYPSAYVPTVRPVVVRPVVRPVRRGGSGRRFVWGLVVVLIVAAAATQYVTLRTDPSPPPPDFIADARQGGMVQTLEIRPEPPHARPWWKTTKVKTAPAASGMAWTGEIERGCVASLADNHEEIGDAIRRGLAEQLAINPAPSAEFVANQNWVRVHETHREPLKELTPNGETVYHIRYAVEVTPQGWSELAREQRHEISGDRMQTAAFGLGLITVLLGAVAGFIRLDEWTKGYYSGRLLFAAVVLVLAAGGGILFLAPMAAP